MSQSTTHRWETMRTAETREVERVLRAVFPNTDAYRYNSASIRVRIIDPRFEGMADEQRDRHVEPLLEQLPQRTQDDIMNLIALAPSEVGGPFRSLVQREFEDPSPSEL